ncbi:MAG: hypothetical protein JJ913_01115 [Rhizobiaceae bacterium]|nr:hypothetical protein [Rhizobiaceae bacterium]
MRKLVTLSPAAVALALLAGCTTSETLHHEGVTSYAGNAIAANTMLQMVDPWQYGVQNTNLETPAERPWRKEAAASSNSGGSGSAANP